MSNTYLYPFAKPVPLGLKLYLRISKFSPCSLQVQADCNGQSLLLPGSSASVVSSSARWLLNKRRAVTPPPREHSQCVYTPEASMQWLQQRKQATPVVCVGQASMDWLKQRKCVDSRRPALPDDQTTASANWLNRLQEHSGSSPSAHDQVMASVDWLKRRKLALPEMVGEDPPHDSAADDHVTASEDWLKKRRLSHLQNVIKNNAPPPGFATDEQIIRRNFQRFALLQRRVPANAPAKAM